MHKYNMVSKSFCLTFLAILGVLSVADADCLNIITRSSWGAKEPKNVSPLTVPLPYVIIHHTDTWRCYTFWSCSASVRRIQNFNMNFYDRDDIGYSFLIGGDGNVYEGRGWNAVGGHTYAWDDKSVGIAFIGTFAIVEPSEKMLHVARELIACGKDQNMLSDDVKVLGARQIWGTLSPGDKVYAHVKNWPEWLPTPEGFSLGVQFHPKVGTIEILVDYDAAKIWKKIIHIKKMKSIDCTCDNARKLLTNK